VTGVAAEAAGAAVAAEDPEGEASAAPSSLRMVSSSGTVREKTVMGPRFLADGSGRTGGAGRGRGIIGHGHRLRRLEQVARYEQ
jgi:hypothetical protein